MARREPDRSEPDSSLLGPGEHNPPMRVAIAGAGGLLGTALEAALRGRNDEVVRLVRRTPRSEAERQWFPESGGLPKPGITDVDAVVNFCGAGIADARWTAARKATLRSSRLDPTRTLVSALEADGRCRHLVNASAIGFYGDRGDEELDEHSTRGSGFLADLVADWEAAAAAARVPVTQLRTGHVLTRRGGFLGRQRPLFLVGAGGPIGTGRQYQSWIGGEDYVAAILHILDRRLTGPVNLSAPEPVTNAEFTRTWGALLRRKQILKPPLTAMRLVLGSEAVQELLLSSAKVVPSRLLESGFEFRTPRLEGALAATQG